MPEERRGGQRPARSPLAPQVGRLDVELDAQFNLIERLLISRGSTCTLKRPENKQIHDPQTGDWSAEWKAYFARLRFCIGELNIAPASFVIAPEAAQIVMVGQAPGVAIDKLIAAPSGAISIAGVAPVLVVDQLISAPAGAAQIAGQAPVALVDQLISAPAGAMQIAGLAPVAQITVDVDAPSGAMEIAGQAPTVEAGGFTLVAQGVDTANATSFSLDPSALGASVGDFMIVGSLWEADSAVTSPSGWTNIVDAETPSTAIIARHNVDYQIFSGSVPGSQSWSYGSDPGVAYAWAIFRGVTGVGTANSPFNTNASTGLIDTSVTVGGGDLAAVFFSYADDAVGATGETASLSGVVAGVNEDTSHIAGRYALAGYVTASGTVSFTTTSLLRSNFQQFWIPLT